MDTEAILSAFKLIATAKGWSSLHSPRNLASAVAIEAAELLEQFQWLNDSDLNRLSADAERKRAIADEMADVQMYLLALADALNIDLSQAVDNKITHNRQRFLDGPNNA